MVQKYVLGVVALAAISISNPASAGASTVTGAMPPAASISGSMGRRSPHRAAIKLKAIMTGTDFATSFPSLSRRPARP